VNRRRRLRRRGGALGGLVLVLALAGDGFTLAAFTGGAESPDNQISAAPDFRPPTVDSSAILKSAGGIPGFIRQSGGYRVYANVSDTGIPPSGVPSATADVSAVTTGATAVVLSAGSFSAGGVAYGFRSAELTANAVLTAGSKAYSVSATDNAANGPASANFSVTVDNTAPAGSNVQTADGGGTAGTAQAGDTITYTFTEPMEPESIVAGWTGGSTSVVVRVANGGVLPITADTFSVWNPANTVQLPLGTTTLPSGTYVGGLAAGDSATFGATGTASTMTMTGSTITITLGTAGGQGAGAGLLAGAMSWVPSASATDRASNPASTATVAESTPPNDTEF
jgi:hypothetical protein